MTRLICSLILIVSTFLLVACAGIKSSSGPGAVSLVKTFNKGKDSLLCFAGPTHFDAFTKGEELEMDYTWLKIPGQHVDVTCNFSIVTPDASFRPDSVLLILGEEKFRYQKPVKFFAEGFGKTKYKYRYSFNCPDTVYFKWMRCDKPTVRVNDKTFVGGRKFQKEANTIYRSVLFDQE